MTAASPQPAGLRVVAPDGCTVADSTALQGFWTQARYLELTSWSNRPIEFTDGRIEVLPMPAERHQEGLARVRSLPCPDARCARRSTGVPPRTAQERAGAGGAPLPIHAEGPGTGVLRNGGRTP